MDIASHLEGLHQKFQELETALSDASLYADARRAQQLTREHTRIALILKQAAELDKLRDQAYKTGQLMQSGQDAELAQLASEELSQLEAKIHALEHELLTLLIPPDPTDSRNTIVEIRAGTGGDEAAIFAADLFRMYSRYAEKKGWKVEVSDSNPSEMGGLKEIIFSVTGEDVYKNMRFESGVHRVQRVPATEAQGRIHTSTATVAVLPEAEEVDVQLKPEELRIEVCRSGGPGGQGVNTTDSAVQILHLPTGMIVRCQDNRSQLKNREKAMTILRSRLYEIKKREEEEKYAAHRRSQVGSGERNEKIRTYNYPQSRITDHRIGYTTHNLGPFMDGDMEEMFEKLLAADREEKLTALDRESSPHVS